jgi:hypothetical protein
VAVSDGLNRLLPIAILGGVSLAAALALPGNRLCMGPSDLAKLGLPLIGQQRLKAAD